MLALDTKASSDNTKTQQKDSKVNSTVKSINNNFSAYYKQAANDDKKDNKNEQVQLKNDKKLISLGTETIQNTAKSNKYLNNIVDFNKISAFNSKYRNMKEDIYMSDSLSELRGIHSTLIRMMMGNFLSNLVGGGKSKRGVAGALGRGRRRSLRGRARLARMKRGRFFRNLNPFKRVAGTAGTGAALSAEAKGASVLGKLGKLGTAGKVAGKAFAPLAAILGVTQLYGILKNKDPSVDKGKEASKLGGNIAGGLAGASAGAAIGTAILPVVGTAIGGIIGGILGSGVGEKLGEFTYKIFKDPISAIKDVKGLIEKANGFLFDGFRGVYSVFRQFLPESVANTLDNVGYFLVGAYTKIQDYANGIYTQVESNIVGAFNYLSDGANKALSFINSGYESIKSVVGNVLGSIASFLKIPFKWLEKKKDEAVQVVEKYTPQVVKDAASAVSDTVSGAYKSGKNAVSNAYNNTKNAVSGAASSVANSVKSAVKDTVDTGKKRVAAHDAAKGKSPSQTKAANDSNYTSTTSESTVNAVSQAVATPGAYSVPLYQIPPANQQVLPEVDAAINKHISSFPGLNPDTMRAMAMIETSGGRAKDRKGSQYQGVYQMGAAERKKYGVEDSSNIDQSVKGGLSLAYDNAKQLAKAIGISIAEVTPEMLYLAHQQGLAGASAIFRAAREGLGLDSLKGKLVDKKGLDQYDRVMSNIPSDLKSTINTASDFVGHYKNKLASYGASAQDTASTALTSIPSTVDSTVNNVAKAIPEAATTVTSKVASAASDAPSAVGNLARGVYNVGATAVEGIARIPGKIGRAVGEFFSPNSEAITGKSSSGLKPGFLSRIQAMANEFMDKTGQKMQMTSGFRSPEKQAQLYAGWKAKKPGFNPANPPGTSWHEFGLAADFSVPQVNKAKQLGLLSKYGLEGISGSKERQHVQVKGLGNSAKGKIVPGDVADSNVLAQNEKESEKSANTKQESAPATLETATASVANAVPQEYKIDPNIPASNEEPTSTISSTVNNVAANLPSVDEAKSTAVTPSYPAQESPTASFSISDLYTKVKDKVTNKLSSIFNASDKPKTPTIANVAKPLTNKVSAIASPLPVAEKVSSVDVSLPSEVSTAVSPSVSSETAAAPSTNTSNNTSSNKVISNSDTTIENSNTRYDSDISSVGLLLFNLGVFRR